MKRFASYRVFLVSLVLMIIGVLLQSLLLSGHIPFLHLSLRSPHTTAAIIQRKILTVRDQGSTLQERFHRPAFETGIVFPQWGTTAYSDSDANWRIGLSDIQKQTAAQWIEMPVNLYQASVYSTQVASANFTPTPQAFAAGIRSAHAMHYHVFVVPFVSANGSLTWSGSIQFASQAQIQAWFDSYWQAYEPFVQAAAQAQADQLAIGTEFDKLQMVSPFFWNQLIDRIRSIFHGKLTYDINWSSLYSSLPTWLSNPHLSAIGVSVYIPLADTPQRLNPATLPRLWKENISVVLDSLAVQTGKPALVSEIGYRDSAYALYRPWERDAQAQAEPPDPNMQAAAYNAALINVLADSHISGIFFWAWSVPLFEPNWKPAAKVLHRWYTSPQA
ncbi:MAG TPA: hypothetical protein VKV20_15810 [Ktedonobacteraceae bacterium]|nr:hypothetical protein [Ktedonobacteraceae bacterium]